jgi:diacylglycerol kinase (ATP)
VNPVAGLGVGTHVASQLAAQCAARRIDLTLRFTRAEMPARALFFDHAHYDRVIVSGGDGTVMEAMNGMVHSDTPLALIAGGTGNVVARAFQLPVFVEPACHEALSTELVERPMDLGLLNNQHYFAMRMSVGYEAQVIYDSTREAKNRLGILAYAVNIVKHAVRMQQSKYQLEVDGRKYSRMAHSLWVANVGAIGVAGLRLSPDIIIDDGQLDVYTIRLDDTNSVTEGVLKLLQQTRLPARVASHMPVRRTVRITSAEPQPVQVDGEFAGHTPCEVTVVPRAVHVVLPQRGLDHFVPPLSA